MTDPLNFNQPTATHAEWTGAPTAGGTAAHRRGRLKRLLELAQIYSGLDRRALAKRLDRDPSRLIPESGNPGLDQLTAIAEVLDWPRSEVFRVLHGDSAEHSTSDPIKALCQEVPSASEKFQDLSFRELGSKAVQAHQSSDNDLFREIASELLHRSRNSAERAHALCLFYSCFATQGMSVAALNVIQQAAYQREVPESGRLNIQVNLATAHYNLCHLTEARAVAADLIESVKQCTAKTKMERVVRAGALYIRGSTFRRMLAHEVDNRDQLCEQASQDLTKSHEELTEIAREFSDARHGGMANTCTGALLEVHAASGTINAKAAIDQLDTGVRNAFSEGSNPVGIQLESWGWWAIFATNIARRHLEGTERTNALRTHGTQILEVANRLDNWTFRAAAYEALHLSDPNRAPWLENPAELQLMIETMGRLPVFRETGWRILSDTGALERAAQIDPRTWRKGLRCA